ncbi:transporter [uncultured Cytophaga sp.]|uniref:transporter n=1 Tax=uncultured Cytophaga sp. TaxID=160238 RepID=UPI00262A999A|nr:transporter [uncultured Cytophaga sp.]
MNIIKICNALLVILVMCVTQQASAQSDSISSCVSCMCAKDATPAGSMISHVHPKGEWMFSYRFMYMNSKGMQQNGNSISNTQIFNNYLYTSDRMQMGMHMLMAMYGVNKNLTLMGMLEYNQATMNMKGLPGSSHMHNGVMMSGDMSHDMKTSGFGDMSLTALYSLLNNNKHHLLLSAGMSIPTGSIHNRGEAGSMYPDKRYPYMMQQGSGTWDVLPGLTYTFKGDKFMASTQATSILRTGYNSVGYKLGNKFVSNSWIAYQWFSFMSTSVRAEFIQLGKIKGSDPSYSAYTEPSANKVNYGGSSGFIYAGVNFYFLSINKIGLEFGLPVYQKTNGIQPTSYANANLVYTIIF